MKIYITGATGTGKTSIARALGARGISSIDLDEGYCHRENRETGEVATWEPGRDQEWYERHGWVCDINRMSETLKQNTHVVVVGLSSNQDEYWNLFDKVFVLEASPEVVMERLNARADSEFGKHPAEQARLRVWQKDFEREMREKGATPLDGNRATHEVVDDLLKHLDSS